MKNCPRCNMTFEDNAAFCSNCGFSFTGQPAGVPVMADPYDHTSEYDPADISENKVIAMLPYLMGWVGIIIALLAVNNSRYVAFHVKQALKFTVVSTLAVICTVIFCWTFVIPIALAIFELVLLVVKIICFFQVCGGKAKEPAIIKHFSFLK